MEIARLLGMSNVPQTRRMACAIIANALVFHERIAGMYDDVKPLGMVCGDEVANPQRCGTRGVDGYFKNQLLGDLCRCQRHSGTRARC